MATHLSTAKWTVSAILGFTAEYDAQDGDDTVDKKTVRMEPSWAFGSDDAQADLPFHNLYTIAASGHQDLDLAGILKDKANNTVTFTNIKAILIKNRTDQTTTTPVHAATTADITIGAAGGNDFIGFFGDATDVLGPFPEGGNGCLLINDEGWTVVADTGDILRINNSDGANEALVEVIIIGDSA